MHLGDFQNQSFRMKQVDSSIGDNSNLTDHTRINKNVVEAVIDHFNDIQRGNFHTNSRNYINPNAHGKGINCQPNANINLNLNSPLDQFLIKEFITLFYNLGGNMKLLFTNMAFYLLSGSFIGYSLNLLYNKLTGLISNL